MLIVFAVLVIASGVALWRVIPQDGYGTRPGPRSRADQSDLSPAQWPR
jgi:hypothetical protein